MAKAVEVPTGKVQSDVDEQNTCSLKLGVTVSAMVSATSLDCAKPCSDTKPCKATKSTGNTTTSDLLRATACSFEEMASCILPLQRCNCHALCWAMYLCQQGPFTFGSKNERNFSPRAMPSNQMIFMCHDSK